MPTPATMSESPHIANAGIFRFCDQATSSAPPAHAATKLSIVIRVGYVEIR